MTTDIRIFKRRDRAFVVGETPKGKTWIKNNIVKPAFTEDWYAMDASLIEDTVDSLKEEELTVEVE